MVVIPTVDELTENTVMKNMRKLAQGVDKNFNEMQTSVDNAVETANNALEATAGFDDRITDNATAIQNEVTARQNADEAEADARAKADITGIVTAIASGAINVTLNRELGNLSDSVVGPFIKTATLIPSSTDRAFKLQFQYWDNTTYTTNDFVIPEGGGTDVSVSGVTVSEGDNENEFKVSIQLDDATTIDSNSYPFPEAVTNPYPTAVLLSLGGTTATTLNIDITLSNSQHEKGSVDLADLFADYATKAELANYVTDTELNEQISDIQEQITGLKLSTDNNNITLNGDSVQIVKTVSGQVSNGNLKITVNGVESGDIPLPETTQEIITFNENGSITINFEATISNITTEESSGTFTHISSGNIGIYSSMEAKGIGKVVGKCISEDYSEIKYCSISRIINTASFYKITSGTINIERIWGTLDNLNIEDGTYRLAVLGFNAGNSGYFRTVATDTESLEYFTVTIQNKRIISYDSINLDATKYITSIRRTNYTRYEDVIAMGTPLDYIEKVN